MRGLVLLRRVLWGAVALSAALVTATSAGWLLTDGPLGPRPAVLSPVAAGSGGLAVGGSWELVDHEGRTRTNQDFKGRVQVVSFGFTHCPDVCPTGLGYVAAALDALGAGAARDVAPLFVSVDPERDTPALLASYVAQFHPAFVGLTGTPAQVARAAAAFRVTYRKADVQRPDAYTVDHTATIWLLDREGRFGGTLDVHEPPEVAVAKLRGLLARTPAAAS